MKRKNEMSLTIFIYFRFGLCLNQLCNATSCWNKLVLDFRWLAGNRAHDWNRERNCGCLAGSRTNTDFCGRGRVFNKSRNQHERAGGVGRRRRLITGAPNAPRPPHANSHNILPKINPLTFDSRTRDYPARYLISTCVEIVIIFVSWSHNDRNLRHTWFFNFSTSLRNKARRENKCYRTIKIVIFFVLIRISQQQSN